MRILVAKSGKLKGKSYTLNERLVFGRGKGCDIVVASDGVSRKHAVLLVREDDAVILRDLASRNGTRMGDMRIRQAFLVPGDRFFVGDVEFEFRALENGMEPVAPKKTHQTSTDVSDRTTTDEGGSPDRRRELLALAKSLKEKKGL